MSRSAVASQRCGWSLFFCSSVLPVVDRRGPLLDERALADSMQFVVRKLAASSAARPRRWRVSISSNPSNFQQARDGVVTHQFDRRRRG